MKPILEIKNISKKFRIQHEKQSYLSLRESLTSLFTSNNTGAEDFFALNDVSFDVNPGDSVGIIGKNGAGKSTLLKILSKITPPSSGKIISRGRIASLLEVGTGFHPELSGRENVFLNGSILGMKRNEIERNFDAIVDFSGVEKFLDTPLKHYSSGMQLRLAFSVAAFLENEILIIDEVLAVGDAEFQKKCMGKMEDVSKSGRTILFVSHNMGAINSLCNSCILLSNGSLLSTGSVSKIVSDYNQLDTGNKRSYNPIRRSGKGDVRVEDISFSSEMITSGNTISIKFSFSKQISIKKTFLDFRIDSNLGEKCYWVSNRLIDNKDIDMLAQSITFEIPRLLLNVGTYSLTHCLYINDEVQDNVEEGMLFDVSESDFYSNWKLPPKNQSNLIIEFNTHYE